MSTDLPDIFHSKFSPIGNSGLWPHFKESANITSSILGIRNEKRLGTLTFQNRDSGRRNVKYLEQIERIA